MIRRTNTSDLVVPFLVVGALAYLVLRVGYESLPPFQWFTLAPIAVLAGVEFVLARRVRNAVRHDPDAKAMTALAIARAVALAKASALGGAAIAGAAAALVLRVLPDSNRTEAASHDLRVGVALFGVCIVLGIAGLVLERAGVDPNSDRRR